MKSEGYLHPKVIVLIATHNRSELLKQRAIQSVVHQTKTPDMVIVVDDSEPKYREDNRNIVKDIFILKCDVVYLENNRTKGASGTWNTGIYWVVAQFSDLGSTFIAILDDDDEWNEEYLQRCFEKISVEQLDMVSTNIIRITSDFDAFKHRAPITLKVDDFLIGNPGVQGSNMFINLQTLLAVGGFDENLKSSTDRDLCIRIAELGAVKYGALNIDLVRHYAESDRERLSKAGSLSKKQGLQYFWNKHAGRMTHKQRFSFCQRAKELFEWLPENVETFQVNEQETQKVALVLGIQLNTSDTKCIERLVQEILRIMREYLVGFDVVLFEQMSVSVNLEQLSQVLFENGIGCFIVSLERQSQLVKHIGKENNFLDTIQNEVIRQLSERCKGIEPWILSASEIVETSLLSTQNSLGEILKASGGNKMDTTTKNSFLDEVTNPAITRWIREDRIATAKARIKNLFSSGKLHLLGTGSESVVFTDEKQVYKCIDYWKTRFPASQKKFLLEEIGKWGEYDGLYSLYDVVEDGSGVVLVYDYDRSIPYIGGSEYDFIPLLLGCYQAKIVCNNVHPKNLIVTSQGIKLIDYGSDIRPWTELGFEHMMRRSFLSARYANEANLADLMSKSLLTTDLSELEGYREFREKVVAQKVMLVGKEFLVEIEESAEESFPLVVGVISSDVSKLQPLLVSLVEVSKAPFVDDVVVLILDNGMNISQALDLIGQSFFQNLEIVVVSKNKQKDDAKKGVFGKKFLEIPQGSVGIAQARTMLQRYVGAAMQKYEDAIGWILDDDMRVLPDTIELLSWLPQFRNNGVDVLIGQYNGTSPNPPINGLRVQLIDLIHNLFWLDNLPSASILPNRKNENLEIRKQYPDYYYDLSRKHTAHLEAPYWIEPIFEDETVREAKSRLLHHAIKVLTGGMLVREITSKIVKNPLLFSKESVNRGGNTFVLSPEPLLDTPNMIVDIDGKEARRSDMVWALANRYYHKFRVQTFAFPVQHVGRVSEKPVFDEWKVQAEIIGSSLYGGITEFLKTKPEHRLNFSDEEADMINSLVLKHMNRRLHDLFLSFHRIRGLSSVLRYNFSHHSQKLIPLIEHLDTWFTQEQYLSIKKGVHQLTPNLILQFLQNIPTTVDEYRQHKDKLIFSQSLKQTLDLLSGVSMKALQNYCIIPSSLGDFRMYDTGDENVRVLCLGDLYQQGESPLVRVHSSCLASETFLAKDCDCADQLHEAMKKMATEGRGIIFHLHQEGRGQGLSRKIKAVHEMQREEVDTHESFVRLGFEQDIRSYEVPVLILKKLGLRSVRLISNNPRKRAFLEKHGIQVSTENTNPKIRPENESYLKSKNAKLNHHLPLDKIASDTYSIQFYHSDQTWGDFSNFSRHAIYIKDKIWPTVEHFYQAHKFSGTTEEEEIRQCETPSLAKQRAHILLKRYPNLNWNEIKEEIMMKGLRAKFTQHPNLRELLLSTGDRLIEEHTGNDLYWGNGLDGRGKNRLGCLLMKLREDLRPTKPPVCGG